MPPTEEIGFPAASIHCSTLFHGHSNAHTTDEPVRCAVRNNLPQVGIAQAQVSLNHGGILPSPRNVVYVEAQDTSDFHPSLKRYVLAWCRSTLDVWVKLAEILAIFHTPQQSYLKRVAFLQQLSPAPHHSLSATHSHLLKPD